MTSDVDQRQGRGTPAGTATLEKVAGLRWREPRLAAELAQEVLDESAERGDAGTWLRAAGWLLHGRSAVGDAREAALDLLADIDTRAGRDVLRRPEAARLRVELAALAQANGDPEIARDLLDGWEPAGPAAGAEQDELDLDRLAVLVRCALVDGADALSGLRADVEALSQRLHGEPEALAELLLGSVHRDDGEPAAAAERALRGLARLGWTPATPSTPPRSPHLGCALLSQWATSLLEDGAAADIPDGVKQLEVVDGGRHGVLWRLAVARAFAGRARPTADVLEDAASAAAAVDAPSLQAACRSAQAELYEGAGRYQDALSAVRAAMEAERTDRERAERLREALAGPAEALAEHADEDTRTGSWPEGTPAEVVRFDGGPWAPSSTALDVALPAGTSDTGEPAAASDVYAEIVGGPEVAGPAMSTLDVPLDAFDEVDVRTDDASATDRDTGGVDGSGAVPTDHPGPGSGDPGRPGTPEPDASPVVAAVVTSTQLPGSRGADTASGEGSPLADALLAELRDAVRDVARPSPPSIAPSPDAADGEGRADADDPDAASDGGRPDPWIVLDLVDGAGRPVRHVDARDVGADLASRAARLVPATAEVRGPDDTADRRVPDSAVEVVVAGAEGVAVRLWARSLVGHLASRVSRRGLPEGTVLRARVHGSDGMVGDADQQALSGPPTAPDSAPRPADTASPSGDESGATGRSTIARLEVRPGSGGRRRRGSSGDDASPVEPVAPRNGTAVEHLLGGAPAVDTPRHGWGEPTTDAPAASSGGRRRRAEQTGPDTSVGVDGGPVPLNGRSRRRADGSGGSDDLATGSLTAQERAAPVATPVTNGRPSGLASRHAAVALPTDASSTHGTSAGEDGDTAAGPEVGACGDAAAGQAVGTGRDAGAGRDARAGRDAAAGQAGGTGRDVGAGRDARAGRDAAAGQEVGTGRDGAGRDAGAGRDVAAGRDAAADADAAERSIPVVDEDGGADRDAATADIPPARDRASDGRPARQPDPLDTSVPVEDVVPDGAVWLKGEWVVPGPLEQASADSVLNGGSVVGPRAGRAPEPPTVPGGGLAPGTVTGEPVDGAPTSGVSRSNGRGSHRADRRRPAGAAARHEGRQDHASPADWGRAAGGGTRSDRTDGDGTGPGRVVDRGSGPDRADVEEGLSDRAAVGVERVDRAGVERVVAEGSHAERDGVPAGPVDRTGAAGSPVDGPRADETRAGRGGGGDIEPDRAAVAPDQAEVGPDQTGAGPDQPGAGPGRAEGRPDQAGAGSNQTELRAVQLGAGPDQAGAGPDQAEVRTEQPGAGSGQAEGRPDQAGAGPDQAEVRAVQPGAVSGQAEGRPDQAGAGSNQAEARAVQLGVGPEQAGVGPEDGAEVGPGQAGDGPGRAGVGPDQAGPDPTEAGAGSAGRAGSDEVGTHRAGDDGAPGRSGPDEPAPTRPNAGNDQGNGEHTGNGRSRRETAAGSSSRRERRPRTERRSGRTGRGRDVPPTGGDPTAIPDDLGLGDLLAGALAAYRDI